MSNWQPIDTAPKDKGRVIVFLPEYPWGNPVVAEWSDHFQSWDVPDEQCGGTFSCDPTHWLPHPEFPV